MKIKQFLANIKARREEVEQKQKDCEHEWLSSSILINGHSGLIGLVFGSITEVAAKGHICAKCGKELFPEVD